MHCALEEARRRPGNVLRGGCDMIMQVAAEIVPFAIVVAARDEAGVDQHDLVVAIDGDEFAAQPFVEHRARAHVLCDRFDQLLERRCIPLGRPRQRQRLAFRIGELGRGQPARDDRAGA